MQTTSITTPPVVKSLFVIDYTVDASFLTRDRTTSVMAGSLRDAIDIIQCDYEAETVHAVYDATGKRLY